MKSRLVFANIGKTTFAVCGVLVTSTLLSCGGNSTSNTPGDTKPQLPAFFVGNHMNTANISEDFSSYWNQLTPEFEGFWSMAENIRNQYTWEKLDTIYAFAAQHNIPVKANALISKDLAPAWIGGLPAEGLAVEMENWIQDYCTRYPQTPMINVVYNAMPGHSDTRVFANALGEDWVIQTFEWAREYCQEAVLILDDYRILSVDTDAFIEWATPIIASGFVDAIGAQAHGLEEVSAQLIATNLDKLATLGLPIYISEWDIGEEDDAQQLEIMQQQLPVFYNHPAVAGITYWGYIANQQFISGANLLNDDGTPRPAMVWLQDYLRDNPRD